MGGSEAVSSRDSFNPHPKGNPGKHKTPRCLYRHFGSQYKPASPCSDTRAVKPSTSTHLTLRRRRESEVGVEQRSGDK